MSGLRLRVSAGLAAVWLAACAGAAEPEFDKAAMDALLSGAVERGEVVGVAATVFDEGQTVYTGAFGLRDRERDLPVTEDTVWRIYSMTKPITSALIMDLEEDGLLSLSDPASKYIPQLAEMKVVSMGPDGTPVYSEQARPMTVEDLLLHRSGMAYGIFGGNPVEDAYAGAGLLDPATTTAQKMDALGKLPLLFQPGEAWMYSYATDVLGRIAEVAGGKPLDALFQERFFAPLGMTETSFRVQPEQAARFATNYALRPDGSFVVAEDAQGSPFLNDNAYQSGGGGLVGTMGDYAKFARMMLDGGVYEGRRILSEETVARMTSDQMAPGFRSPLPWLGGDTGVGFGYGGSVQTRATPEQQREEGRHPGQWGWSGAARTTFYIDPENDAFGIIMLQMFAPEDPQIHADFRALALRETRDEVLEGDEE